ncbi:hypothetical protein [Paenibacillus sp. HB172176]|uniref:hypothetical protein n=1 Tax=Paenibacillus sp. HB172176 TaxID=2493690 RepID=UPI00143BBEA9|nr:hypothetical protein [Paenibacillus sp. HB172176]
MTISNVSKNLLFQDKQVAQIKSAISTSNSFAANKYAYDNNIERTDEVSQILNTTWSAIDRQIEGGLNNSISMSRRGIIVSDSSDPSKMLIIQNGVLAISSDSGKHWRTAVTNRGIIAERIVGQLIAGNDLTVTNQSGSFTIDDNGMTATEMDLVITRTDKKSRIKLNATDGLLLQKNIGTTASPVWSDQIVLDTNGDVIFKGKVEIGSGNSLFKADSNGISLGSSTFANAPFSVDLTGKMKASNVQVTGGTMQIGSKFGVASDGTLTASNGNFSGNITMNSGSISWANVNTDPVASGAASAAGNAQSTANSAISTSAAIAGGNYNGGSFIDGRSIKTANFLGGTIEIGSLGNNNVFKADSTGIWLGHQNFANAPFRVGVNGSLVATNATIQGNISGSNISSRSGGGAGTVLTSNFGDIKVSGQ